MTDLKLIVTDLDGTFLYDHNTVSEANLAAVRRAIDSGLRFVVATGRPLRWLGHVPELLELDPLIIASNGACVVRRGEVVLAHHLDPEAMLQVALDLREAVPGIGFAIETADGWAREAHFARVSDLEHAPLVDGIEHLPRDGVLKLLATHADLDTEALAAAVAPVVGDRLTMTYSFLSTPGMLELSAAGVSKASTLAELLQKWQIPPWSVAAFGDMPNDRAMLDLAGAAFVPANAHPSLLEAFEVVGHHRDDGVGQAIERLLDADPLG